MMDSTLESSAELKIPESDSRSLRHAVLVRWFRPVLWLDPPGKEVLCLRYVRTAGTVSPKAAKSQV